MGGISAGDVGPKEWEVRFALTVFCSEGFVGELGWTDEGPVELAVLDNGFHGSASLTMRQKKRRPKRCTDGKRAS
jgi:hypothetical protein